MLSTLIAPSCLFALAASPAPSDLAAHFPPATLAYAELAGAAVPGSWCDRDGFDALLDRATELELIDADAQSKVQGALTLAQLFTGEEPFALARHLLANGAAFGVTGVQGEQPDWALVVRGDDAELLERLVTLTLLNIGNRFGIDDPLEPTRRVGEAELWALGELLAIARHDATLLAAPSLDALEAMLQRDHETSLASAPGFDLPEGDLALFLDRAGLAGTPQLERPLERLLEAPHRPEVQFLLGGSLAELATATSYTLGLELSAEAVRFELGGRLGANGASPLPATAAPTPRLTSAATTAGALVFRNLDALVAERNTLFAPELQPKFTKTLADMTVLIGGLEIEEDLLPYIDPWIEVGVASFDFSGAPRPELALPGAVFVLEVAPEARDYLVAGFQTTLGISNAERAQQGDKPYVMQLKSEGAVTLTAGHLPRPAADEAVDTDYNLAPACALVGEHFVVGTHEGIVRAAVRDLERAEGARATARREHLAVRAAPLAALARASHDFLVMQAILNDNKSHADADAEWRAIERALDLLEGFELVVETRPGHVALGFEVELGDALFGALGAARAEAE